MPKAWYQETKRKEAISDKIESILPFMVYFWLIGVLFYFFRHAGNFAALQQLKARADESLPQNIIKSAQKLKQQLAIPFPVNFKFSVEIAVPIAYGVLKPVVLIPVGLIVQLSPIQLEAIIAHELAHIRRHDFVINLGQFGLEIVFFYHPAFWWINTLVKEAREHIADDMAIDAGVKSIDLANALAIIAAKPVVSEKISVEVLPNNFITSEITSAVSDSLPQQPVLGLRPPPVADFKNVFNDSLLHRTTTIMSGLGDSVQFFAKNIVLLQGVTSILSQSQTAKLQANLKALQLKMVVSQNELEQKMKAWEKEFQPQMKAFERKMEA